MRKVQYSKGKCCNQCQTTIRLSFVSHYWSSKSIPFSKRCQHNMFQKLKTQFDLAEVPFLFQDMLLVSFFELFMVQFLSDQSSCQSSTKKLDVELILPSSFSWSKTCGLSLQKLLFLQKASNPEDGVLQALKATNYLGSFQKSCSCPIWIDNDGFSYT